MDTLHTDINILSDLDGDLALPPGSQRTTVLTNKVTSVLASSYADPEIGEVLQIIDSANSHYANRERRNLRREVNKDVIDCNAAIIRDFGQVAEVGRWKGRWGSVG